MVDYPIEIAKYYLALHTFNEIFSEYIHSLFFNKLLEMK